MGADYCPFAIGPTMGATIWLSWVFPLLCGGEAHALGPQQWWTDNSNVVGLMLDEYLFFTRIIDK